MAQYVIPILGRYAVLQNNLAKNKADNVNFQQNRQDFFADFAKKAIKSPDTATLGDLTSAEMLMDLTMASQEIFFEAKTIFPFVLFPDTISLDRQKLTIVHRGFFRSAQIASVQIKDIMNVQAIVGPLFGSLTLTSKYFLNNMQTINFLKRDDIIKVQRLIQGFMIAHRTHINIDTIDREQLTAMLNDLGQGSSN